MSLLMQALKKAEQIKQKQSGAPSDETLTLSPKELAVTTELVEITVVTPENRKQESSASTLTLSPHMEEKPAELVSTEPDFTQDVVVAAASSPIVLPASPLQDDLAPHHAITSPNVDAGTIENKTTSDASSVTEAGAELGESEAKNISRPEIPKFGAEQKQIAEQAEKIVMSEQKKAKSVFSSKTPQPNQGAQRRTRIGIYVLLSLLVLAAIAYLYWQSMNVGLNSTLLRTPAPLPTTAAVATPDAEAAAKVIGNVENAATPQAVVTNQASAMSAPADAPRSANLATAPRQNFVPQVNPVPVSSGVKFGAIAVNPGAESMLPANASAASPKVRAAPSTPIEESAAIQVRRNSSGNQINPALSSAYQYFISGDAAAAKLQYQKVLQQDPNNRDALLGMAAIALNQRQAEQAGSFYGRLLELDPADPDAIAGLTSLQQGDPVQSESRLKKSLSQNPQAGAVLFALGNLYAQQSRWSDAQQTYFRAYTTTPGSADYAFNLAISLDKLNQVKLAREYYQRALTLGQNSSGNFSRSDVQKRITELEAIAKE